MPKAIRLFDQHVRIEKGSEIDPDASDENGPVVVENWTLVMTDKRYGDQLMITFGKDVRDALIKDLMGGVILPGV